MYDHGNILIVLVKYKWFSNNINKANSTNYTNYSSNWRDYIP